jgi:hypothetical protein
MDERVIEKVPFVELVGITVEPGERQDLKGTSYKK